MKVFTSERIIIPYSDLKEKPSATIRELLKVLNVPGVTVEYVNPNIMRSDDVENLNIIVERATRKEVGE